MTTFGTNLKNARIAKGWTQQQLANKTGLARHNIGAYEEGRAEPPVKVFFIICRAFNITSLEFAYNLGFKLG